MAIDCVLFPCSLLHHADKAVVEKGLDGSDDVFLPAGRVDVNAIIYHVNAARDLW